MSDPTPIQPDEQPPVVPPATTGYAPTLPLDASRLHEVGAEAVPGYEIVRELGRGGMGVVYLARQTRLNRLVALKMILAGGQAGEAELARFKTEAEAIARLRHPGIVAVHEVGEHDGKPYFSLEYCDGGSLERRLAGTPIDPREAAALVRRLADAMAAAHAANVVHRDLKPANVLLVGQAASLPLNQGKLGSLPYDPKVTDFGLAKLLDVQGQTRTGAIMGTPSYMAPEQASGSTEISPLADVYSLGAILYECLSGRPPFKAATTFDTVVQVISQEPVSLRSLNAKAPADLETICHKCLQKDPARRYAGARELADDLGRFLDGRPVLARPVGRAARLLRWCRRNPAVASLSAAVVLLLLGAAVAGPAVALQQAALRRDADDQRRLADERADEIDAERRRAEGQARAAREALYAARQQVAMNAWRENRADRLAEVLSRQEPDLRGFEWSYLDRLSRSPGRRWRESGQMVNGVAIAPDGKTAVTVGFDGKATAWDVATGKVKWDTGEAFRWSVNAAAISPDGKTIALAGHLGQLQLWSIDGKPGAKLQGHGAQVFGAAFSPDGKTLASASADLTVRLWDVASGRQVAVLGGDPDKKPRAAGPQAVASGDPAQSVGHTNMVWQAAWSPDGKRLATCSTDGSVKLWSVPDRKLLRTMTGHEQLVIAVAWSPDGRQVASVSRPLAGPGGGEGKLWNPETGRAEATFRAAQVSSFHAVAFTPDGLFVVTAGSDRAVRVWRKDGRPVAEHKGFRDEVIGLAVHGRWAVAGSRAGEVVAFDLDATPGRRSAADPCTRLAFAPDGRLALFDHGQVRWREPESLAATAWPRADVPPAKEGDRVFSNTAAFSVRADGQSAHAGHTFLGPGTVVWRDAAGQVRRVLTGHAAPITAVAFLPGDRLASADEEGGVRIWDAGGKAVELRPWEGPVRFLAATADGRLWAGGAPWAPGGRPGRLQRPTASDGRLARVEGGQVAWQGTTKSAPLAADLSPDGAALAVSHEGGDLAWIDARTGAQARRQASTAGVTTALRFSPDQRRLAAGGADGAVRLLDAASGEELLVLEGAGVRVNDLAFSRDGRRLAVAASAMMLGGTLTVWDGQPAGDFPPLPPPDLAWHKARFEAASDKAVRFGPRLRDRFALRYHLERLAALEPGSREWPRQLLAMDQDDGDARAAAARLDGILRRWPDDAPMWYDLGNAKRELGDDKGAELAFRRCVALDATFPEGHCNLGLLLGRQGRFAEAVASLSRGHELGEARKMAKQRWPYPSGAWLARFERLRDLAAKHEKATKFDGVPEADRADLVEVLTLTQRPLAAVNLAAPKPDTSPGVVVLSAALRCADGVGDASGLSAMERTAWRAKALAWLKGDLERIRTTDPGPRAGMARSMQANPLLMPARGERTASWPEAEREAWRLFWDDVKAVAEGR